MSDAYDLFVIGAGSGGVRAARIAAESGARVGVAEQYRPGGTCVIRGCVPKKFMVYASEFSHLRAEAAGFGWTFPEASYDHGVFLGRLHAEIDRLSGLYAANLQRAGAELFMERAALSGPDAVRLADSGRTLRARRILVATGGAPSRPNGITGAELAITSDDVFHLEHVPGRALVLGGGYIAVEFAAILNGLGAKTLLAYRGDPVLRGFDTDLRRHVQNQLAHSGVEVWNGAAPATIAVANGGRRVAFADGRVWEGDTVLMALGRKPATEGLGLEQAGIELAPNGSIRVDEWSRTAAPSVWAIGDVTDRINLTPVAIREGEAFARTEFLGDPTKFLHQFVASAVFVQPPAASVGLTEEEAETRFPGDNEIYRSEFRPMRDVLGETGTRMLIKLVVSKSTRKVLGCHLAGPDAAEIIQPVAIAMRMGATKADFDHTCAVHPTLAEEMVTLRNPL